MVEDIAPQFCHRWAIAQSDVLDAYFQSDTDEERNRMLKWFICLHSMLLRTAGKSRGVGRPTIDTMGRRFTAWQNGDLDLIVGLWEKAERSTKSRGRRNPSDEPNTKRIEMLMS